MPYPAPQTIRRALGVLERLPAEALADLTERLIDRLDASEPEPDLEPEEDCCTAGECGGLPYSDGLPGEPDDAEHDDGDDQDGPRPLEDPARCGPVRLRAERDGLVKVWRRSSREFISRGLAPLPMELAGRAGTVAGYSGGAR